MPEYPSEPRPFRAALPALLALASLFLLNFLSRVSFSPLMPVIERDLAITHAGSGGLFLLVAVGYGLGLLLSGALSEHLCHRTVIGLSGLGLGVSLGIAALCTVLPGFKAALLAVGLFAGAYLPSGIATLTALTRRQDWGKALAVHEMAPNLSFILAPLLAEAVISVLSWRCVLGLLAALQILGGAAYLRYGRGRGAFGQAPRPALIRELLAKPQFWALAVLFGLALGASVGAYSMIPLYLVSERGFSREAANQLLAVSRISGLFASFAAGFFTDRFGYRPTLAASLVLAGLATALLGPVPESLLVPALLIQPFVSVLFFPAGFTALSRIFGPTQRSIAVSLVMPVGIVVGLGLVPAALGQAGEAGSFQLGFALLGALVCLGPLALPCLK